MDVFYSNVESCLHQATQGSQSQRAIDGAGYTREGHRLKRVAPNQVQTLEQMPLCQLCRAHSLRYTVSGATGGRTQLIVSPPGTSHDSKTSSHVSLPRI